MEELWSIVSLGSAVRLSYVVTGAIGGVIAAFLLGYWRGRSSSTDDGLIEVAFEAMEHTCDPLKVKRRVRAALASHPDNVQLVFAYASWLDWEGDNVAAIPILREALVRWPGNFDLTCQLAWALVEVGIDLDEAESWIDRANGQNPNSLTVADTRAWLCYKRGDLESALRVLLPSLPLINAHPEISYHAGAIYAGLGDLVAARRYLEVAVRFPRRFSGRADAVKLLGELLSEPSGGGTAARK